MRRNAATRALILAMLGITRALAWCPGATGRRPVALSSITDPLIDAVLSRAKRRLGDHVNGDDTAPKTLVDDVISRVEQGVRQDRGSRGGSSEGTADADGLLDVIDATIVPRAKKTLDKSSPSSVSPESQSPHDPRYKSHPAITATALAHSLWASVVRPWNDTVVDATAGNGHDAVQLARLLFPHMRTASGTSELFAMDIQTQACVATRAALDEYLSSIENDVGDEVLPAASTQVLCQSHATLPHTTQPIGLIAYNLGYLPGSTAKEIQTDAASTLDSLAAAAPRVRKGGLVSVVVYPDSEPSGETIRDTFTTWAATGKWRCREHASLGLSQPSPVLYTALRIKPDGDAATGAF